MAGRLAEEEQIQGSREQTPRRARPASASRRRSSLIGRRCAVSVENPRPGQNSPPPAPARHGRRSSASRSWMSAMRLGSTAVSASAKGQRPAATSAESTEIDKARRPAGLPDPAQPIRAPPADMIPPVSGRDRRAQCRKQRGLASAITPDEPDARRTGQRPTRGQSEARHGR